MKKAAVALVFLLCSLQGLLAVQSEESDGNVSYLTSIVVDEVAQQGDAVCIFCSIVVNGGVSGDVVAIGGNIIVNGTVGGDTVAAGGYVVLGPGGTLGGELAAIGGSAFVPEGAEVAGEIDELPYMYLPGQRNAFSIAALTFLGFCLLLGVIGIAVLRKRHTAALAAATTSNWIVATVAGLALTGCLCAFFYLLSDDSELTMLGYFLVSIATGFLAWLGFIGLSAAIGSRFNNRGNWALQSLAGSLLLGISMVLPVVGFASLVIVFVGSLGAAAVGFWHSSTFRQLICRACAARA